VDIEIKNKLLEVIREIRAWDPEEDSAETLLTLCDEFNRVKPDVDISLEDWTDITQLVLQSIKRELIGNRVTLYGRAISMVTV
jgi:hypothetical protein